jgi:hypothetical protein
MLGRRPIPNKSKAYVVQASLQKKLEGGPTISRASVVQLREAMVSDTATIKFIDNHYYAKGMIENLKKTNIVFFEQICSYFFRAVMGYFFSLYTKHVLLTFYSCILTTYVYTAIVYNQWSQTKETISGIYLILNTKTNIGYIGKSVDIMERFQYHCDALRSSSHHNKYLQKDFLEQVDVTAFTDYQLWSDSDGVYNANLEDFHFLFLEVNLVAEAQRKSKEIEYISNWPGLLYNITYNKREK